MKPIVAVTAVVLVAVGASVVVFVTRPRHSAAAAAVAAEEPTSDLGGGEAPPRRPAFPRAPLPTLRVAAAEVAPAEPANERQGRGERAAAEPEPTQPGEVAMGLKQHLDRERPDPSWAAQMQGRLEAEIYNMKIAHTSSVNARCGASLCEVTVKYDGDIDRNATAMTLARLPALEGGSFYQYDAETSQMTVYVARPGKTLMELAAN